MEGHELEGQEEEEEDEEDEEKEQEEPKKPFSHVWMILDAILASLKSVTKSQVSFGLTTTYVV